MQCARWNDDENRGRFSSKREWSFTRTCRASTQFFTLPRSYRKFIGAPTVYFSENIVEENQVEIENLYTLGVSRTLGTHGNYSTQGCKSRTQAGSDEYSLAKTLSGNPVTNNRFSHY